ncbi:MAG: deoxyribose-phosphate aldolase [Nitrospirae bacterium]|nr:deoxyribose-phosphate aldolase [Nitrospirota bacterium]
MLDIARLIDHSLLRPDAVEQDIVKLCNEAIKFDFHSVCVHPFYAKTANKILFKTHNKIAVVIGFPLGMTLPQVKIYEAMEAVLNGADELDVVINISNAKSNNWKAVEKEISDIITATPEAVHKIIIETCFLTDEEKKAACRAVINAGAEYIKTSTGFGPAGAVIKDVKLIKSVTKGKIGIKAAGGIKTLSEVKAFIEAGASRIGTSSSVEIMKEAQQ